MALRQGHKEAERDLKKYIGLLEEDEERTWKAMQENEKRWKQEAEQEWKQKEYERQHPEVGYQKEVEALKKQNSDLKGQLEETENKLAWAKINANTAENRLHQVTGRYY